MGPNSSDSDRPFAARKGKKTSRNPQNQSKSKQTSKSHKSTTTTTTNTINIPRKTLSLDGRTLEGGGQLVRVALTLSALLAIPIHIHHIRGRRAGRGGVGGLKESHLAALTFLAEECGAEVQGAWVGSAEVVVEPGMKKSSGGVRNGKVVEITLEKPGSVWLVWQALFPYLLFQDRRAGGQREKMEVVLKGGTNVSSSMSGDYVQQIFLPICEKIGLPEVEVQVIKRGWAGNVSEVGEVQITIHPWLQSKLLSEAVLPAFSIQDRGAVRKICITVVAHPKAFSTRLVSHIELLLRSKMRDPTFQVETVVNDDSGDARRLYVLLVAHTDMGWRLGRDYLGGGKTLKNEKDVEQCINEASERVVTDLFTELSAGGCVDRFLQDQLIVLQALAGGRSIVEAGTGMAQGTLHTRTVRWVCEEMLNGRGLEFDADGACVGIGHGCECNSEADREVDGNDTVVDAVSRLSLETTNK